MDNVGGYFHDHISFAAATITGRARRAFVKLFTPALIEGTPYTPKPEALLACVPERIFSPLWPISLSRSRKDRESQRSAPFFRRSRGDKAVQYPENRYGPPYARAVDISKLIWSVRVRKQRAITDRALITLRIDCEQASDAANRITLAEECDAIGMPRAVIAWRISEHERRTVGIFAKVVDTYLNQLGFGAISWNPGLSHLDDSWLKFTHDTFHPMGGTRMGVDSSTSVVDSNLKVHGTANLFVASCSAFPAGGSSNPTFTLMALTLRLGAHLAVLVKDESRPAPLTRATHS